MLWHLEQPHQSLAASQKPLKSMQKKNRLNRLLLPLLPLKPPLLPLLHLHHLLLHHLHLLQPRVVEHLLLLRHLHLLEHHLHHPHLAHLLHHHLQEVHHLPRLHLVELPLPLLLLLQCQLLKAGEEHFWLTSENSESSSMYELMCLPQPSIRQRKAKWRSGWGAGEAQGSTKDKEPHFVFCAGFLHLHLLFICVHQCVFFISMCVFGLL
mmetsp:Transcript_41259/g.106733  ORF Transcript_41259/g.106733 Transcript_41259/m.106733 type:complete len:209 (-) Transcript_41259:55-681(-)